MNSITKTLSSITHWSRYLASRLTSGEKVCPILAYHSISDAGNKHTVNAERFEQHMSYFSKKGMKTIALSEYVTSVIARSPEGATKQSLPPNSFILTFDDGFADFCTTALSVLKKYNFTATVFVVPGYVGSDKYMNWAQIREIIKSGMEIGSHTLTHPNLERCLTPELERELGESKSILEKETGQKIDVLAYPYGRFNEAVKEAAKKVGYKLALTTNEDVYNDNFTLGRTYITSGDSAVKIYSKIRIISGRYRAYGRHELYG